jgi:tetratricopeptide (TPR) repeat protein
MQDIINALRAKNYSQAIAMCQQALLESNHPQIHLFMAIAYGESGQLKKAQNIFAKLIQHFPENADIHYNFALILYNNNCKQDALKYYQNCLKIQPQNPSAWNNLGEIYRDNKEYNMATAAFIKCRELQPNNTQYLRNLAISFYQNQSFDKAQPLLLQLIQSSEFEVDVAIATMDVLISLRQLRLATEMGQVILNKHHNSPEIYNLLGLNELEKRKFNVAIDYLQKALSIQPDYIDAMCHLASAYLFSGQLIKGKNLLETLSKSNTESALVYVAMMYENINERQLLTAIIDKGLSLFHENEEFLIFKAKSLKQQKQYQSSLTIVENLLASLKNESIKASAYYLKSQVLDKLKFYDKAWTNFETANQLSLAKWHKFTVHKDTFLTTAAKMSDSFNRIQSHKTLITDSSKGENLIFIVGFPRSGTTLLDSVLSAHSDITVLEEAPILGETYDQILGITPQNYAQVLMTLTEDKKTELRKFYYNALKNYTDWNHTGILVDKSPLNTMHAGLIQILFPRAKIIFSLRHPMDVCLSCFFQDFKMNGFMTNLTDIDSTAKTYDAMLNVWQQSIQKFNITVYYQSYEKLVTDFEKEAHTLFKYLNLNWQEQILNFQETLKDRGAIATPSYDQVNQPIYQSAKNRYKNYLPHMQHALRTLEPWIIQFGYK